MNATLQFTLTFPFHFAHTHSETKCQYVFLLWILQVPSFWLQWCFIPTSCLWFKIITVTMYFPYCLYGMAYCSIFLFRNFLQHWDFFTQRNVTIPQVNVLCVSFSLYFPFLSPRRPYIVILFSSYITYCILILHHSVILLYLYVQTISILLCSNISRLLFFSCCSLELYCH